MRSFHVTAQVEARVLRWIVLLSLQPVLHSWAAPPDVWHLRQPPVTQDDLTEVSFLGSQFMAVSGVTNRVLSSLDGTN